MVLSAVVQFLVREEAMRAKRASILAAIIVASLSAATAALDESVRVSVTRLVAKIQRADYEGDRAALKRLHEELTPFVENKGLAVRIRYWRGFALWRRATNGFNDSADPKEIEQDLKLALDEFSDAIAKGPGFVDAKVGMVSCLSNLIYLNQKDATHVQELIAQSSPLLKEAKAAALDNPRLLWVFSSILWNTPGERGGGQAKAIEMLAKGLEESQNQKKIASDPLDPSWGEPELLMGLAWSNLNRTTADLNAAEQDARSALELVPYWHYVRDILMPQIRAAKTRPVLPGPRETAR
jgi:hypothetical protein